MLAKQYYASLVKNKRINGNIVQTVKANLGPVTEEQIPYNKQKGACVVNPDTLMPGLSVYDFGDSIRFEAGAAQADRVGKLPYSIFTGRMAFQTF